MSRPRPAYLVTFTDPAKKTGQPRNRRGLYFMDSQIRRAIRRANRTLKQGPPGRHVTVRGWQPQDDQDGPGLIEYQAHLGADRKIHVEER
jgi:hypothetical protein